jgi:hypothetical protein
MLADLIDLELLLARDRERPLEERDARDARIAPTLEVEPPGDRRALLLAWLRAVRGREPSLGARLAELRETSAALLFITGIVLGASAVGGWLLAGTGTPVNVVMLWPAVVGVQLALLVIWCIGAAPARALAWLPGLRGARSLIGSTASLLTALAARVAVRGRGRREEMRAALAELRRLDWLYGRLRFWLTAAVAQSFAVGFNFGALAACAGIPLIDDPAFGWRSRHLEPPALHRTAELIATPWRAWVPEGAPTLIEVEASRYSSLDPRFAGGASALARRAPEVWGAWWPLLIASLLTYGLLPRLVLWLTATWVTRRELARAKLDHADCARLAERLLHLRVHERAAPPATATARPAAGAAAECTDTPDLTGREVVALAWAGVPASDVELLERLAAAGAAVSGSVHRIGGLDLETDERALAALEDRASARSIALAVEAFEPPTGDYVDFLRRARARAGSGRTLWVILCGAEPEAEVPAEDIAMWCRALGALGDPWLRVCALTSLPERAKAEP